MDYSRIQLNLSPARLIERLTSHKLRYSLPLAVLAAAVLIFINEVSYHRSQDAVESTAHAQRTRAALNSILQQLLDAETGQRGYLLTGDAQYLKPYEIANNDIARQLATLRELYASRPEELGTVEELASFIARKQAELDLTVRMRKQGNEDAWKFIIMTDVGLDQLNAVRTQVNKLVDANTARMEAGQREITRTLQLSRIAIALVTLVALLAFHRYLQQSTALKTVSEREQEALQKERDQLERLVVERTERLGALATHLQHVREEERGHLARELHDELGSLLTAAKLDVTRLRSKLDAGSPEAADRLQHLTATLNSGIALSRRIIEDLRPSSLANLGLAPSLEILAREFEDRSGLRVTIEQEPAELPPSSQLTVYRLIQESLTNIGKYADAQNVTINLQSFSNYVTVDVSDDGKGFKQADVRPTAHGLIGMKHRVEVAGGRLHIVSVPGQGTRVSAVLPKPRGDAPSTPDDTPA